MAGRLNIPRERAAVVQAAFEQLHANDTEHEEDEGAELPKDWGSGWRLGEL